VIRLIVYTKGYILWDSFEANRDLLVISIVNIAVQAQLVCFVT